MSKKIKILFGLMILFSFFLFPNVYATNCTLNNPSVQMFNNGSIVLNVTSTWEGSQNVTNITWTIGSSTFLNNTINGTSTTAGKGDFTYTLITSDLSEGAVTTYATCFNDTASGGAQNSTSITYTVDRTDPAVTLNKPNNRQTVSKKGGGFVDFEYTPSDTNLGNATMYLDGAPYQSSTSGTINSNLTSGAISKFNVYYSNNNLSRNWIVEVTDLAGRKTNSSSFTLNVFARGAPEAQSVFVTPSGEVISSPAQPKGKPLALGNIGDVGNLLSNPFVWGGLIVGAVGLFIWWQNRKR